GLVERLLDGGEGGMDHPVALTLERLVDVADANSDGGRRRDLVAPGHMDSDQTDRLEGAGGLVVNEGAKFRLTDLHLAVGDLLEPLEGTAELCVLQHESQLGEGVGETSPARVLAEDD